MSTHAAAFVPPVRPEECVCDPLSWDEPDKIPAVCDFYQGNPAGFVERRCMTCDHDFECHKVQK